MKRRDFCQTAGLVAGSVLVPTILTRAVFAQTSGQAESSGFRLQLSTTNLFRQQDLVREVDGFVNETITAADLGNSPRIFWRVTDDSGSPVDLRIAHNYGYFDDRVMLPHLVDMYNGLTLPWVIATYGSASVGVDSDEAETPDVYELGQNYPNPFRNRTTVPFSLAEGGRTRLKVYNILGREVATLVDSDLSAGRHEITWESAGESSGTYLLVLTAGSFKQTRQLVVVN